MAAILMLMHRVHPTVLIVAADDDSCARLTQRVRAEGYGVETARDGCEALEKVSRTNPHVILLELNMPDAIGNGFRHAQLAERQRKRIPVVMYSLRENGHPEPDGRRAAAHVTNYLERLMALIRKHCQP